MRHKKLARPDRTAPDCRNIKFVCCAAIRPNVTRCYGVGTKDVSRRSPDRDNSFSFARLPEKKRFACRFHGRPDREVERNTWRPSALTARSAWFVSCEPLRDSGQTSRKESKSLMSAVRRTPSQPAPRMEKTSYGRPSHSDRHWLRSKTGEGGFSVRFRVGRHFSNKPFFPPPLCHSVPQYRFPWMTECQQAPRLAPPWWMSN